MLSGKKLRLRKIASGFVFWTGLIVIGIFAVPAVVLLGIIHLIWEALDIILKKIDRD